MFRNFALIAVGLAGIANLNASYIQIGGNTGLTSSNVTGSTFVEAAYAGTNFQGTTPTGSNGSVLCAGATIGTCTSQANSATPMGEPSNEFATGNGVTFALINESTNLGVWAAPNTGTNSMTVTLNIFGVTNVYTLLNDEYGVNGSSPTTVKFTFSDTSTETFTLVNGKVIREAIQCTGGSGLTTCNNQNWASTLDTTNMYGLNGALIGAITPTTTANVTAFNVWSGTYTGGTANRANTTGNLYMDAQNFYLGSAASGLTLVNMTITDTAGGVSQISRDLLSAVTVQTASGATPEPSTGLLIASAVGGFAWIRRRRKQS